MGKTTKSVDRVHPVGLPQPSKQRILAIRRSLLRWYDNHARSFVWRAELPDPYVVLLSEFMLQQTQTARVQQLLPLFMQRFPDVQALATASNAEIIVAWKGMGYNSRALRLRDCARAIVERFHGQVPQDVEILRSLPGIGPYTAAAIAAFAFHRDVVVVDVNIERIVQRVFALPTPPTLPAKQQRELTNELVQLLREPKRVSAFYQAMMDVGAQYCTARRALCAECPLQKHCLSAHNVVIIPKVKRAEPSHRNEPNRIWRGRCVELLRQSVGHHASVSDILHRLIPEATRTDARWFDTLIKGLERDAIVRRENDTLQLAD